MSLTKNYPVLVIPAFNPDEKLKTLLTKHAKLKLNQACIVVNDGSHAASLPLFRELESLGFIILHHEKNLGKGAALKTAMDYYLQHFRDKRLGIITADADGQHCIEDIVRLSEQFLEAPDKLHLGVRTTHTKHVPLRSRLGNGLTRFLFNILTQSQIVDTQTGLRAIPLKLIPHLLVLASTRYEFEFEMFFVAKKQNIAIAQMPIKTIYIDDNRGSHFHPLRDSFRIYFLFFRCCCMSLFQRLRGIKG